MRLTTNFAFVLTFAFFTLSAENNESVVFGEKSFLHNDAITSSNPDQNLMQKGLKKLSLLPNGNGEVSAAPLSVLVYPNPIDQQLNLQLFNLKGESLNIKVLDITGKVRLEDNLRTILEMVKLNYDVSSYNPGIYFVIVSLNDKVVKQMKVLKQ